MVSGASYRRARCIQTVLAGAGLASLVVCFPLRAAQTSNAADQSYKQAVQALQHTQWDTAVSLFEETLRLDPHRAAAQNGLGVALGKLGNRDASVAAFQHAIEIDARYAEAHYNLGLCLEQSGDLEQAISELKVANQLKPDYVDAQYALGITFQQKGDVDRAVEFFEIVLREDPRSAEAHNALGLAYVQKNRVLESLAEFQQAVDVAPEYVPAYENLASTLAQSGKFTQAAGVLRSALAFDPGATELHFKLGHALRAAGDLDGALHELMSLAKSRDSAQVESEVAATLRAKGDFREAIEASEKALSLAPSERSAYVTLGLALRDEAASTGTRRARSERHLPSPKAKAHYNAGSELLSRGDLDGSEKELERAVQLDPTYAEAHNLLGFVLGNSGDLTAALKHLHRSV